MDELRLTVVMPALNEEKNLRAAVSNALSAMNDMGIRGEVLVVNDGSTDATGAIAEELGKTDARVRCLHHAKPGGIGAAFWDGVDHARGDVICMLPGDNENDPWEIFRYFGLLDHVDMVIPFVFNREARSLFRNALSWVYRFIINTTFLVNFNYTNGTVMYRKSLLLELPFRSTGFFFQTDILVRSAKRGYLFAEAPYRVGMRKRGVSKAVTFPSLFQVCRGYLRLVRDMKFRSRDGGRPFASDSRTAERHKQASGDNRHM
jgi:glycosyltransferase involved in cell wall biosynthesis